MEIGTVKPFIGATSRAGWTLEAEDNVIITFSVTVLPGVDIQGEQHRYFEFATS